MSIIVDPDFLDYETTSSGTKELFVDYSNKKIKLVVVGNLSADGVTLKCVYSKLKELWKTDTTLIKYPFPITPITDEQFELVNGWDFDKTGTGNTYTPNLIRTGGWALKNLSNVTIEQWAGIVTLGSIGGQITPGSGTHQVYFQQTSSGSAVNINRQGPVNQAIRIYNDPNGDGSTADGFNYTTYLKLFVREQGYSYALSQLSDIGVSSLTYQVYRFPLSNASDLKITHADVAIDANSDGAADVSPYSGMSITWYGSAQVRSIGGTNRNFSVIIDGNNATAEQIYEFVQFRLRQTVDIDAGAGTKTGKLTRQILKFVGDTLYTLYDSGDGGVFIDNYSNSDINRLVFADNTGTDRTFPFIASGTISFNDNLVNDGSAKYWVFFNSTPSGNYGTASAVIAKDASGTDITGTISSSPISFTFDYDGNVQGGRTAGTDATVVVVAIGLGQAQYVKTTGTIARSTANSFSLTSPLERNYSNP